MYHFCSFWHCVPGVNLYELKLQGLYNFVRDLGRLINGGTYVCAGGLISRIKNSLRAGSRLRGQDAMRFFCERSKPLSRRAKQAREQSCCSRARRLSGSLRSQKRLQEKIASRLAPEAESLLAG